MVTRWRGPIEKTLGFMFFAGLLIAAAKPAQATCLYAAVMSSLVPCKQRFIGNSKTLWKLRQLYFLGLGTAWLITSLNS